jgi:hypothetical protein
VKTRILAVAINAPADKVYGFVHNPENIPGWASAFVKEVKNVGGKWVMVTTQGEAGLRFCPDNDLGVADHYVEMAPGHEIYVPLRVVKVGDGCEAQFTLIQESDMDDARFEQDAQTVIKDLNTLKSLMEK